MRVKLDKPKGNPGRGQAIAHCAFCERENLVTVSSEKSGPDGFQIVLLQAAEMVDGLTAHLIEILEAQL